MLIFSESRFHLKLIHDSVGGKIPPIHLKPKMWLLSQDFVLSLWWVEGVQQSHRSPGRPAELLAVHTVRGHPLSCSAHHCPRPWHEPCTFQNSAPMDHQTQGGWLTLAKLTEDWGINQNTHWSFFNNKCKHRRVISSLSPVCAFSLQAKYKGN